MAHTCYQCGAEYTPGQRVCSRCAANLPDLDKVRDEAEAEGRQEASSVADSAPEDEWTSYWANICGVLLLLGFFCPIYVGRLVWPWEIFEGASFLQVVGILLPLFLGIAVLVIGRMMRGVARATALLGSAVGAMVLSMLLAGEFSGLALISPNTGGNTGSSILQILMILSAVSIAAGNRLRKRFEASLLPRLLAGVGGSALLLCFVLPLLKGDVPIAVFFHGQMWEFFWPMMLVLLAIVAYGGLGAASFHRPRNVQAFCGLLSLAARVIVIGIPASMFFTFAILGRGEGLFSALTLIVRACAGLYGFVFLLAVSLAAFLEKKLEASGT